MVLIIFTVLICAKYSKFAQYFKRQRISNVLFILLHIFADHLVDGCNLIAFAGTTASFARFVPQKTRDGQKPIWWMEEMMKYIFSSVSKSKVLVSQYLR